MKINAAWIKLEMVKDGDAPSATMSSAAAFFETLQGYFSRKDREEFVVACVDNKHRLIALHVVSVGSLTMSIVHPREAFKLALLCNASAVLFAHNHPSGDPAPSAEDRQLTRRLVSCGELLGVPVLDHVIFGADRFFSFADHRQMDGQ